jgi:hypothetical protein
MLFGFSLPTKSSCLIPFRPFGVGTSWYLAVHGLSVFIPNALSSITWPTLAGTGAGKQGLFYFDVIFLEGHSHRAIQIGERLRVVHERL